MTVSGVRHLVERAYRESGELQYLRELLVNAIEAGAHRIEFGPEWRAVERAGVYRLMVADDGKGMSPSDLLTFLNTFGGGGKPIGDAHENFGVGSKTSLLPWNHEGVIVLSWTEQTPDGAMVWLMRDAATGEYGARKFETDEGFEEVVEPPDEWRAVKPTWIGTHGTVVVCLRNTGNENTFLGKSGAGDIKGIAAYLNKRLWQVPEGIEIYVQELRSNKAEDWPRSLAEASGPQGGTPDRRWNRRQIFGAAHYLTEPGAKGAPAERGTVKLSDGTEIDWFLWEGERPAVHSYAHRTGYLAALYKNELYDTQLHPSSFRSFGITHGAVRENLTLIARPPMSRGSYGVYPDTARNALKLQGTKQAGEGLPWADWAEEFADRLPDAIRKALAKAAPATSGTIRDSSWQNRLFDRFGARWKNLRFVFAASGSHRINPDEVLGGGCGGGGGGGGGGGAGAQPGMGARGATSSATTARSPNPAGQTTAEQRKTRGALPRYEWTTQADLDPSGAAAVAWNPRSASEPDGLIQIARDFPSIVEVKRYWRSQYPDSVGDEVDRVVEEVYGEVMVARIAHSEALVSHPLWGRTRVDRDLRSGTALTMALLGLLSEDQIIAQRLTGLGVRRKAS